MIQFVFYLSSYMVVFLSSYLSVDNPGVNSYIKFLNFNRNCRRNRFGKGKISMGFKAGIEMKVLTLGVKEVETTVMIK